MKTTQYKGHSITRTTTTTNVGRCVFGKQVDAIGYVYEIKGPHGKNATVRPFLTSIESCREYINAQIGAE